MLRAFGEATSKVTDADLQIASCSGSSMHEIGLWCSLHWLTPSDGEVRRGVVLNASLHHPDVGDEASDETGKFELPCVGTNDHA